MQADKLRAVIDLDVWKNISAFERNKKGRTGRSENFDASQFLLWLQALLSSGVDEAVTALAELGTENKNVEHGDPLELGVFVGSYVQLKQGLCLEDLAEIFQEILSGFEPYAPEVLEGVFYKISRQVCDKVAFEVLKPTVICDLKIMDTSLQQKQRIPGHNVVPLVAFR